MKKQFALIHLLLLFVGFLSPIYIFGDTHQDEQSTQEFAINPAEEDQISQTHTDHPQRPQTATTPFEEQKKDGNEDDNRFFYEFLNMLFTLGLIISLLFIVSWFLKRMVNSRMQQMNVSSLIKIVEHRNLSSKSNIYLIEIQGKVIAVGESHNGLVRLAEFEGTTIDSTPEEEAQ